MERTRELREQPSSLMEVEVNNPPKKLLLHVCCAPCSPYVIDLLKEQFEVTLFFYDPNIHPKEEYLFRLEEARELARIKNVEFIEGEYDVESWHEGVKGHEKDPEGGDRCAICFSIRLGRTAEMAEERKEDLFTTALTISPYKNSKLINEIGQNLAKSKKVDYYVSDFKKKNGTLLSVRQARDLGLKRQNYCGCIHSRENPRKPRSRPGSRTTPPEPSSSSDAKKSEKNPRSS